MSAADAKRIAELSDPFDPDRSDLEPYLAMVDEFGATSVLDVGCGTGTFACLLAEHGIPVIGVDPDAASVNVARAKPGGENVRWFVGDATTLPPLQVDITFMTANVAQVFTDDDEWMATLTAIHRSLKPGGRLVFGTRDPARRAWRTWTREDTLESVDVPGVGSRPRATRSTKSGTPPTDRVESSCSCVLRLWNANDVADHRGVVHIKAPTAAGEHRDPAHLDARGRLDAREWGVQNDLPTHGLIRVGFHTRHSGRAA
jgi:SAM-dependent methyltransferase